jgi:hypothetical protein
MSPAEVLPAAARGGLRARLRRLGAELRSSQKARDVEETLDVYFYRPLGYVVAKVAFFLGLTPNFVTVSGMVFGVLGAHLFVYPSLGWNVWGLVLLVVAETMDSADGQLARLSGRFSALGRLLDGLSSNIVFVSVYAHLWWRLWAPGQRAWVSLLVVAAGTSHSLQCAAADYYRNAFLRVVHAGGEGEPSSVAEARYRGLRWQDGFFRKLALRLYVNYTREQELLAKPLVALFEETKGAYPQQWPDGLAQEYRALNAPLLKYHNILTSNTRMIALGVALILGRPWLYLAFEVVVLNGLLAYVVWRQRRCAQVWGPRVREAAA